MYCSAVGGVLQIVGAIGFDMEGCVSCGCNIASSACIALENKHAIYKFGFFFYRRRRKKEI
jgi:ferredoxin-like protein FixX